MGIPDHLTCLRNLYAGQEATIRTGHGTTDWFQIGRGVHQGCILLPCWFNLHAEYIMRNVGLDEAQAGIKIAGRYIFCKNTFHLEIKSVMIMHFMWLGFLQWTICSVVLSMIHDLSLIKLSFQSDFLTVTSLLYLLHSILLKQRGTKEPLDEGERGEWKSWLKTQHSEN